jgi:hypothetical protein
MTERVIQTSKRLAAMRQIHAAIGHFHAGDFECAITLCSAAEGQMPEPDEPSRHLCGRLKQAGAKSDDFNFVATWMKHGWGRDEVEIPQWMVAMWLNRAISKYRAVYGGGTPEMTALFPWASSSAGDFKHELPPRPD